MPTIHHLGLSQSERIVWLFEELGLPYDLIRYDRDPTTRLAPDAYKALHPLGTAPVFEDGGLTLAESGAIIEYVIHTYAGGRLSVAPGRPNYTDYLFWWHFANGSLMPASMIATLVDRLGNNRDPLAQSLRARLDKAYELIDSRLAKVPYFAGDELTAADIIMFFPLTTMRRFGSFNITQFENIKTYLKRIGARPAYRAAMTKAEPGMPPNLD